MISSARALLLAVLLLAPAVRGADPYGPTTLVYPTFKHDLGFHHVSDTHLRIFTGNRHRFRAPRGIAAVKLIERDLPDKKGDDDELTVYGVNSGEHSIIYNTSDISLAVYGKRGSGPGEFLSPFGVAANPEGDLYVSDTGNDRIVHLRNRGGELRELWTLGSARGDSVPFDSPRGLALATSGDLYVADTGNHRIVVLDRAGRLVRVIGGGDLLRAPEAIALLDREEPWSYRPDAFLVVIDRNGTRVRRLGLDGGVTAETGADSLGLADARFRGAAIDYYHQIWLTDEAGHRIMKLDSRLKLVTFFGREGGGDHEFHGPFGITCWRRFGQFFISEGTGAQYYWVGVDVLGYHAVPAVFDPGGRVVFTLTERARVTVEVADRKGKTLTLLAEDRPFGAGERYVRWDGKGGDGARLPPGKYMVRIRARATYSSSKHFEKKVEFLLTLG
ncbi:MAG: FlgD immunoglobulin-like domain containing protein [Candidatus Eisenbacteria bacterium]